ncbi:NAD(P)/FAD-dependent oxidoreductase [Acidobacteriota bacterium]
MTDNTDIKLDDGSRIAVIGGGPAGSFFSYFLLAMTERMGLDIHVDIYESRDFANPGPTGCNMCGGIISESLVQALAAEGIELPPTVVQRGIDSYFLHMDVGSVKIDTPLQEKRIAAVFRGGGPKGTQNNEWGSFDGYLLDLAQKKGAEIVSDRVVDISIGSKRKPHIKTKKGKSQDYDLLTVAAGVNSPALKLISELGIGYTPPGTTKTFICEYKLGEERIGQYLGNSMHTFLLSIPRLEFAAIVPKGNYATACMLGYKIDKELVEAFFSSQAVRKNFPSDWESDQSACQCAPRMNISAADPPFFDRIVFIGDSGVSRLYKDGIGAAYRTSKAAAKTVVFEGVSKEDFQKHFWPICRSIKNDNVLGKLTFMIVGLLKKVKFARAAILRMVSIEQKKERGPRRMSNVLWDMFTGSAPYKEVFFRTLHPAFLANFMWNVVVALWPFKRGAGKGETS